VDPFVGKQNGPATGSWHRGKFVDIASVDEVVVEAAVESVAVSVDELVEGVAARFTEVVGTATGMVVAFPLIVVSTKATVGVEVVLVVVPTRYQHSATLLECNGTWIGQITISWKNNGGQCRRAAQKQTCKRRTTRRHFLSSEDCSLESGF